MMMCNLEHCLEVLKALHVVEVMYCLSGGGDSGTVDLDHVLYADGKSGPLPIVTLSVTDAGGILCLDECLEGKIYDLPDGDWINNEGGHGTVILRPQEIDPDDRVECAMTYGDDSEDSDFEDEDGFNISDFDEPEPGASDQPIAVDDTALQPSHGDRP